MFELMTIWEYNMSCCIQSCCYLTCQIIYIELLFVTLLMYSFGTNALKNENQLGQKQTTKGDILYDYTK